jgi:hypothetical protein
MQHRQQGDSQEELHVSSQAQWGKIQGASKEENMVIIKTTSVRLVAMYITLGTPLENIIETVSKATEETSLTSS